MPIFKYTVTNNEGKKLSGTIETQDTDSAKKELNSLGFSVLAIEEVKEAAVLDKNLTKFVFEAVDKSSKMITGTIPATTVEDAMKRLFEEYSLTVVAIWKEGSTQAEIEKAKKDGVKGISDKLQWGQAQKQFGQDEKDFTQSLEYKIVQQKVDYTIQKVTELLTKFDKAIDPDKKVEINKKIDKLLRIKNSTNVDYILETTKEILLFIQSQEKFLTTRGFGEQRLEFILIVRNLMNNLSRKIAKNSATDDVLRKIDQWESAHKDDIKERTLTRLEYRFFNFVKKMLTTQPEILAIRQKIKTYNKQLWDFIVLYFKEPTPEYKVKIKKAIYTVWDARKKAKQELRETKEKLRDKGVDGEKYSSKTFFPSMLEEITSFTGWLLALYLIYYFVALYITTKDLGVSNIPKGLSVYDSYIFKYILAIVFLLHSTLSVKINFFKNSIMASIVLLPIFVFGSAIILLNY